VYQEIETSQSLKFLDLSRHDISKHNPKRIKTIASNLSPEIWFDPLSGVTHWPVNDCSAKSHVQHFSLCVSMSSRFLTSSNRPFLSRIALGLLWHVSAHRPTRMKCKPVLPANYLISPQSQLWLPLTIWWMVGFIPPTLIHSLHSHWLFFLRSIPVSMRRVRPQAYYLSGRPQGLCYYLSSCFYQALQLLQPALVS